MRLGDLPGRAKSIGGVLANCALAGHPQRFGDGCIAAMADWLHKAEKAVDKQQDDLARIALERYHSFQQLAPSYEEQVNDQRTQVEARIYRDL